MVHVRSCALFLLLGAVLSPPGQATPQAPHEAAEVSLEHLWQTRDARGATTRAIRQLKEERLLFPENASIHWQLARFHYWAASTGPEEDRAAHAEAGWKAGMVAQELAPDQVEGFYWAAACVGPWADNVGLTTAMRLGLSGRFEDAGFAAVSLAPAHDEGGPLRSLARYYMTLPFPFRDLERSRDYLDRALLAGPRNPANLFFLADLEDREGHPEQARAALGQLLELDPRSGDAPGILRYQALGRTLQEGLS